ncbi:hypothetical protein [Romboutsia sp.]|uniref:hypothetical protein n=1 Tax=Romboutsia sp. TaxID=1965302 RepID=UPI002C2A6417|nr:hypothetical protein [Romboutsia sp.]HSQ90153.1 hypothetical protein [Romboutsia sp.]
MNMEEKQMLFMLAQTQHIIIEQLNSIIDVLGEKLDIPVEGGQMKIEVGDE